MRPLTRASGGERVSTNYARSYSKFKSEKFYWAELGWRSLLEENLTLDLTGYYAYGEDLRVLKPSALSLDPGPPAHAVQTLLLSNNGEADIFGFELAATWKPFPWCSLWCAYTFFKSYFERRPTWYAEVPEVRAPQN